MLAYWDVKIRLQSIPHFSTLGKIQARFTEGSVGVGVDMAREAKIRIPGFVGNPWATFWREVTGRNHENHQ
jgi:hypothetical protein